MTKAITLALILAVGVAGCKGTQGGQPSAASATAAASTPTASVLPPAVEQAEALAEDVQTDLEQNAWPAAEAKVRDLRGVRQKLDSIGIPQTKRTAYGNALDSLGAAITRRSQADALTAGNRVSRVVTGIMAGYPTKVPVDVTMMDVAGRDALYAAQQKRWGDAAHAAGEVERSYAAVQVRVRARNPALDGQVTTEIAQLHHAVDSRAADQAVRLARALLQNVDRIEQAF